MTNHFGVPRDDTPILTVQSETLVFCYCGAVQSPQRFAEKSNLRNACVAMGAHATFPIPKRRNWSASQIDRQAYDIRRKVQKYDIESVCLVGYSDGGNFVHMLAPHVDKLTGMWIHSGTFNTRYIDGSIDEDVTVVLSYNDQETTPLPRFGWPWHSMQDYWHQANEYYIESVGVTPYNLVGEGNHFKWPRPLNTPALQRMFK